MIQIAAKVQGFEALQARVIALSDDARRSKFIRRGVSEAIALIAKQQKNLAPIRKPRLQVRTLERILSKKKRPSVDQISRATRRASVVQKKFRAIGMHKHVPKIGPKEIIPPGLLKRSIHSRTKLLPASKGGGMFAKAGPNVGVKKRNRNFAPHAHLVSLGTKMRKTVSKSTVWNRQTHWSQSRGKMPSNAYIKQARSTASGPALKLLERRVREDFAMAVQRANARASSRAASLAGAGT